MSGHPLWSFRSIFDTVDPGIPTLHLTECELYILWILGEEGPMSIYSLATKSRPLPEIHSVFKPYPDTWKDRMKGSRSFDYHFVHTKVGELLRLELIQKQQVPEPVARPEKRKRKGRKRLKQGIEELEEGVGLTFLGLMFYLQNLEKPKRNPNEKLKHALDKHRTLMPFSEHWNSLTKDLGEDKCMRAFSKTVREFVDIRKLESVVPSTDQVFDRFVKRPLYATKADTKITLERDIDVARFLQKEEISVLKDCYLAYLIINDMDKSPEENEGLESEKELAYLEKRDPRSGTLFEGGRLREYLPKYSSIEYYFTGMFVKNLLWNEKTI